MVKLRLAPLDGVLAGQRFELRDRPLVIGRAPECDIRFPEADGVVSSRHARVERQGTEFVVVDQRSTNGTLLNGKPVERATLAPGDIIQLSADGPRIHVAVEEEQGEGTPARSESTAVLRLGRSVTGLSFYNPEREKAPRVPKAPGLQWLGIAVALLVTTGLGLVVLLLMLLEMGIGGAVVGTFMAFMPAPVYLLLFLWLDRYDPEPAWALAGAFAWGGLFALVLSYFVNTIFGVVVASIAGDPAGNAMSAVISAPFVEELSKGLGVILIMIFLRREFDGVLDGIVYAGVVALGFATVENVFYYGRKYVEDGIGGVLVLAFLRGVLAPFSHSLFTSATGIGCGISRETHNKVLKVLAPVVGLFCAMTLHGMWNGIASLLDAYFFVVYFLVWIPLFLFFFGLMVAMAVREQRIVRRMLEIEVVLGFVTAEQQALASSFLKRAGWMLGALSDLPRLRARRRYLRAITKLAFCYWHVARASAAKSETMSLPMIPNLKAEMKGLAKLV